MKGYRTIIVNVIALVVIVVVVELGQYMSLDVQKSIGAVIAWFMAAINIFMRCMTDTPVGWDDPKTSKILDLSKKPYG